MGSVSDNRERMLSEGTHPAQVPRTHSTAAEGAVTRTDKFGHSMPILRRYPVQGSEGTWGVDHEGSRIGYVTKVGEGWWGRKIDSNYQGPHPHRHAAVASLFNALDPATYLDRDEAKHRRDVEVGKRAGLTEEEST